MMQAQYVPPAAVNGLSKKEILGAIPDGDGYCLPSYHQSSNIGVEPKNLSFPIARNEQLKLFVCIILEMKLGNRIFR